MEIVIALLGAVLVMIAVYGLLQFGLPWIIVKLGNIDAWWSPYRTLPPPGEMYIMVSGDPDGPFDKIIESVEGYRYDEEEQQFVTDPMPRKKGYLENLGVAKIGFWKYFLWREVRYDKWEKKPDPSTEYGLVSKTRGKKKEGELPSIFFRYNMATEVKAAETKDNFPVDAILVFTTQIERPVKAFFFAGGWEVQVNAAVQGLFRQYVSDRTIEVLREEKSKGDNTLVDQIKELSNGSELEGGLLELYGVKIIDARFVIFDLVKGEAEMAEALRAISVAERKAQARVKEAEGKREAMIVEADGEKEARIRKAVGIREEVAAWGSHPVGKTVVIGEAIKEAKPKAIGGDIFANINVEDK